MRKKIQASVDVQCKLTRLQTFLGGLFSVKCGSVCVSSPNRSIGVRNECVSWEEVNPFSLFFNPLLAECERCLYLSKCWHTVLHVIVLHCDGEGCIYLWCHGNKVTLSPF